MGLAHVLAFALSLSISSATYQGFNYGATKTDGSVNVQSDFQSQFQTAKGLIGADGFNSARLYTTIQGGTTNDPTEAIPAAIAEDTTLLLGLWASSGSTTIDNEIAALKSAISQYGESFTKLVVGISVGSEDLYRDSVQGIESKAGIGADPDTVISYIKQVRSAIAGTSLSKAPIGHVDTWTAWTNSSVESVIQASDWIGVDAYPYFQNTMTNSIQDAKSLFDSAISQTQSAAGSKPVWITETGWPISGENQNLAVPSVANAKTYWDEVGCSLFGKTNTWWYILQDANPTAPNPSFGIVGSQLSETPLYNLTCPAVSTTTSSSSSSSSSGTNSSDPSSASASGFTTSTSGASATGTSSSGSSSGSGSGSGSTSPSGTGSASKANASTATTNGANGRSGSIVGAVGALIGAIALLA